MGVALESRDEVLLLKEIFFEHEKAKPFVPLEGDGRGVDLMSVVHEQIHESQPDVMFLNIFDHLVQTVLL